MQKHVYQSSISSTGYCLYITCFVTFIDKKKNKSLISKSAASIATKMSVLNTQEDTLNDMHEHTKFKHCRKKLYGKFVRTEMTNGDVVSNRIDVERDHVSVEAHYHKNSDSYFFKIGSYILGKSFERKHARQMEHSKLTGLSKFCNYLVNNDEWQYSLSDLLQIMSEFCNTQSAYSEQYLKDMS